ncbi:hypothetical protein [Derxia lacustris]|uniref:hypothetical protein n=1 Tax=Derxia lacustris TaxID=764842 RepID=UPI000A1739A3|nr:hypothetical protein [Derxia lacustris]
MRIEPFLILLLGFGFWLGPQRVVGGVIAAALFGATAVVAMTALGGAPITPAVGMIPFLLWYALKDRGGRMLFAELAFPQPGFWLGVLTLWILVGAFFFPRLFQGDMYVFSTDRSAALNGGGVTKMLLRPISGNLTQSAYALLSTVAFVAARCLLQSEERLKAAANGVLWLGGLNLVAVLLNLLENYAHAPPMLALIKNAEYAVMENGEVAGLVRISGTFSEPSSFAGFSLPVFAFAFTLYLGNFRRQFSGTVALLTLLSLIASTSSTAMGALVLYFQFMLLKGIGGLFSGRQLRFGMIAALVWLVLVLLVAGALAFPSAVDRVYEYGYNLLYKKLDSDSALERHSWNMQAWENFLDSYGIGVGVGSARASNYLMVLLSNLGVVGAGSFIAFAIQAAFCKRPAQSAEAEVIRCGARHAMMIALMGAALAGAVFDLGMAFYMYCAVAAYRGNSKAQASAKTGARLQLGAAAG